MATDSSPAHKQSVLARWAARSARLCRLPQLLLSCVPVVATAAVTVDPYGWTVITPSQDSRVVYVSSSEGSDANDGLSPETPKATIAGGDVLIRDGFPDHLLLQRGDTFAADGSTLYRWKNGRSASEPVVLAAYGAGARPVIEVPDRFIDHNGQTRNYQAFIGLDFYKSNSDPASPDFENVSATEGMRFVGGGANLLIEDCRFRFLGIVVQSYDAGLYTDVRLRRNIILDTWVHGSFTNGGARIQGLFMSEVAGYLIEENFFDHNGWSETVPGAGANMFNHNAYIQYDNRAGGVMRGNIFARGAAHGLQARSGGVVERNLFVLNAVSVNVGGVAAPTYPEVQEFPNAALENVILNGRTMHPSDLDYPRTAAVWGISVPGFITDVWVDDNIVANRVSDGSNAAFEGYENMNFGDNISYEWDPAFDSFDPAAWPHPDADLGDYYASVDGSDSTTAYLTWLRERPPHVLSWDMTAYAAINYIRAGFNRPAVAGYYGYEGSPIPVITIAATDAVAGEPGNPGAFTVTALPAPESPITVNLAIAGLASNGSDYTAIPPTVTIGAGGTGTIAVEVINDSIPEVPESVVVTLMGGEGYSVGGSATATVMIADDDSAGMSIIRIVASDAAAGEPDDDGEFTVTATPAPSHPIQVEIDVSGTAENGTDYHKLKKKVKIDRSGETTIGIRIKEDALIEATESVVVELSPGKKYLVDPQAASAVVSIADDTPQLTIVASDAAAGEGGDGGQFALIADPAPRSPLAVKLTIGGTAVSGTDYANIPTSINVGTTGTATIDIIPTDDDVLEGNETVTIALAPGALYTIGEPGSAEVTIDDNEDDLPAAWQSDDVGNVPFAGSVSYQAGTFTVEGSGADIWGGTDQFHFVHQSATGDCEIVARVVSIEPTSTDAKAGVMIRANLEANSTHALMEIIPNNAAEFIYRAASPGNSGYAPGGAATAPLWVRLVRSGNTFTAYRSSDGSNWTQVGSTTIAMPADVRIGLAVTSNTSSELCTAVFDNVNVSP